MKDPSRMILLGAMFLLLYVYFILVLLTNEKCERAWKTGADSAEDDILIVERYRYDATGMLIMLAGACFMRW
jgi:hypothetical protein